MTTYARQSPKQPVCVHIGRDLLGQPHKLFYLCIKTDSGEMVWSQRRKPHAFSIADAIALAPVFKLQMKHGLGFWLREIFMQAADWNKLHSVVIGEGIFVTGEVGGKHILYEELLAAVGCQHLANDWFSHGVPSLCVQ